MTSRPDSSTPAPRLTPRSWITLGITAAVFLGGFLFTGQLQQQDGHYGLWSILPPLVAIVLAFWIRQVIPALFIGIVLGGLIAGQPNVVEAFMIPAIGTADFALILLVYLWSLGGLIGIWARTGGAEHFAAWASARMVKDRRSAKLFTWIMGLVFHQGGTISTVLTGATVRPIADRHRVSHEELAYMVDSTASPAATVIPFNVWPIYVGGLVAGTIPLFETSQQAIAFFFQALPFNFYAIFAMIITLLFALELLPWIPGRKMRRAIQRAREHGQMDHEDAEPMAATELTDTRVPDGYRPGLEDFFVPIIALLGVAILPYLVTFFILGRDEPLLMIAEAFVLAVLSSMVVALAKGMPLGTVIAGFVNGCKGVTIGAIILALAVSLKEVTNAVGTATYVVAMLGDLITPTALPAILLGLCMLVAFSTGTSWGTYAVVFPVAMPLAWAVAPDPFFVTLCFAAVIGGSVFGDQCSPISDTTILSSLATGCDLLDHVHTQAPLALCAALLAAIAYSTLAAAFV